jgi:lipopolysaccharide export system permease protein
MALKIYERHLAKEIYVAAAFILFAFLMLFAFFDLINELDSVGRGGYKLQHALGFIALTLPGRLYELFPIGILIGTLYALVTLARHSEIAVLRASGLSTRNFIGTFMRLGSVFVVFIFLLGEFVVPFSAQYAQHWKLKVQGNVVASEFRSGAWVKDDRTFINVAEVGSDSSLNSLRIFEFDHQFHLNSVSEAKKGRYVAEGEWLLSDVVRTVFSGESARVERYASQKWKSALNPELFVVVLMISPDRMSIFNLVRYITHLSANQQKTNRYEIAFWKKLTYPLTPLVMMVLALPFAYVQDRTGATSTRVFMGVMLGVAFHMLNGLFSNLGTINSWPPFLSAITPSFLFLLVAMGLLWWVERR